MRKLILVSGLMLSVACKGDNPIGPVSDDPCATNGDLTALAAGGVCVFSNAAMNGRVRLPSSSGAEYLVIAANLNEIPDQIGDFLVKADPAGGAGAIGVAPAAVTNSVVPVVDAADLPAFQERFEQRLRAIERRDLRIPAARAHLGAMRNAPGRSAVTAGAIPSVGDKLSFNIPKQLNPCNEFTPIQGTVRHVSQRAVIITDDASPPGGFTAADFEEIGREFDEVIYPTGTSYFGTPLDLDENGRILIIYTPEVNKLTPNTPAGGGFVAGFFFAGDLFPSSGTNSCRQSNTSELFYLLTPDPQGVINGNVRSTAQVRQNTRGTIAHEFQHMINASERIKNPATVDWEVTWLDEALSHLAEDATGRVVLQLGDRENAGFGRIGVDQNLYSAFFFQNLARFQRYLQRPAVPKPTSGGQQPPAPTSEMADTSLAVRGAAWAFLLYTADHHSPGGDMKAFTRALTTAPDTGTLNLTKRTNAKIDTLYSRWLVTNYTDDLVTSVDAKFTYRTYNMRDLLQRLGSGTYPLAITTVSSASYSSVERSVRSGSGDYYRFPAGGADREFRLLASGGTAPAAFTGASIIVVRTQ